MLYFLLPELSYNIQPHILKLEFTTKNDNIYISNSISKYINVLKKQINLFIHHWDNTKKFTNPFFQNTNCG